MITEFYLSGPVPSKKNSRVNFRGKGGRLISLPGEAYTKWHKENLPTARTLALTSGLHKDRPFYLSVSVQFKDRRRRDLDNALSSILDLLVDAGVIPDDCWERVPQISISGSKGDSDMVRVTLSQST